MLVAGQDDYQQCTPLSYFMELYIASYSSLTLYIYQSCLFSFGLLVKSIIALCPPSIYLTDYLSFSDLMSTLKVSIPDLMWTPNLSSKLKDISP
ncbi:hypothetical protein AQUCO_00400345v1 [Aquilegia coerulea]|uniref:Uncharacterized protein n=1 Tax=Aquilegia coerulea TaxID=218851 RepID=A0A2G5EUS6_AQUCA|nr:hypothetical protein AQUCO_00400345v1 [Aquilegia coerulea]